MDKYFSWLLATFREIIHVDEARELAKKHGEKYADAIDRFDPMYSSLWRYSHFYDMKNAVVPRKMDYSVSSFKIQSGEDNVIYAILYGARDFEYVCLHYTYASMDGEFRRNFIAYWQIQAIYDKYPEITEIIEQYLIKYLQSGAAILQHETFGKSVDVLDKKIDENRLPIKLLVAHWIAATWGLHWGGVPGHLSNNYEKILVEPTRDLFKMLRESTDVKVAFVQPLRDYKFLDSDDGVRLGQKYTMPTLEESRNVMDVSNGIWREIYISQRISALVINSITSGVPIFVDWFVVPGLSSTLFDNDVSYRKIVNSARAEKLTKTLSYARGYTLYTNDKTQQEYYWSQQLENLSDDIETVQDSAEASAILGDETICSIVEDVGFTWGNLLQNMSIENVTKHQGLGPILSDVWMWSKYMFETAYTLMALNDKCGVIQGDMHYNNCTLNSFLQIRVHTMKHTRILYRVRDKLYLFPHFGRYSTVIDFSRAILDHKSILESELDAATQNKLIAIQRNGMMALVSKFRPEFYEKNHALLLSAVERDPTGFWQVLRCVDMLQFCSNLSKMLSDLLGNGALQRKLGKSINIEQIRRAIIPHQQLIIDYCNEYLDNGLKQLLGPDKVRLENPNHSLIRLLYSEYEYHHTYDRKTVEEADEPDKPFTIIDYLSMENNLVYETENYDKFPPLAHVDTLIKHDFLKIDKHAVSKKALYIAARAAAPSSVIKLAQRAELQRQDLRKIPDANYNNLGKANKVLALIADDDNSEEDPDGFGFTLH